MSTDDTTPINAPSGTGTGSEGEFEEGLRTIVNNFQTQMGRPLTADELAAITRQARSFFDGQVDGQDDSGLHLASNEPSQPENAPVELGDAVRQDDEEANAKPPYPPSFYELARLISSAHGDNPTDLLKSLLCQKNLSLDGLKTIPNKLNDQKPSPPVLAAQIGAGKKPWEAAFDPNQT
ncbi:hypothetical protein PTTG_07523 [Puccinia triticina 1-1 BBBD Race 1]|uniref:Peroxisomal membrane protein PEX14-like KPWE domain-containing protein n=2 Tax=Puccinia triticina TaxID=208348 RepID=A0A180G749_PUCT1|nr:uncharacterized protein PtA15_17A387 [Puccinia triticina]OAV88162.1 hypothetical protein PTTG_07523 [Puccinia triticina 1-1 BBBD Race 1]WAQ92905.1 hypothetical protein PtA15_17A387 [Puccinia triticina]